MEIYERDVVTLIRASGARVAILPDHRLLEKWRRYSQERYGRLCAEATREEVFRFAAWTNGLPGIHEEIARARLDAISGASPISFRPHNIRAWEAECWFINACGNSHPTITAMSKVSPYTIKPGKDGFWLAGPTLPNGFWSRTARLASRFARLHLAVGAAVEVYAPNGKLHRRFEVGSDRPSPSQIHTS